MNENEKNPLWKGDDVGYCALHNWVRRRKQRPEACEYCHKHKRLLLANISGEYKRDVKDYIWLCGSCHRLAHASGIHKNNKYDLRRISKYRETKATYYAKNAEEIKAQNNLKYRTDSRFRKYVLLRQKAYNEENLERIHEYKRKHYQENNERIREDISAYRRNGYDKAKNSALNYVREKYKDEFILILKGINKELTYKQRYRKAHKILKNSHKEEFLSYLNGYRAKGI
jgi:hypothetical protein